MNDLLQKIMSMIIIPVIVQGYCTEDNQSVLLRHIPGYEYSAVNYVNIDACNIFSEKRIGNIEKWKDYVKKEISMLCQAGNPSEVLFLEMDTYEFRYDDPIESVDLDGIKNAYEERVATVVIMKYDSDKKIEQFRRDNMLTSTRNYLVDGAKISIMNGNNDKFFVAISDVDEIVAMSKLVRALSVVCGDLFGEESINASVVNDDSIVKYIDKDDILVTATNTLKKRTMIEAVIEERKLEEEANDDIKEYVNASYIDIRKVTCKGNIIYSETHVYSNAEAAIIGKNVKIGHVEKIHDDRINQQHMIDGNIYTYTYEYRIGRRVGVR